MENEPVDTALLRKFTPLDGLKRDNLVALSRKAALKELQPGRQLFREGDSDKRTFYLVSGEIELRARDATVARIRGNTVEAKNPLVPGNPRRFTARAVADVVCLEIDTDLLDVLLTWDQTGIYEVNELTTGSQTLAGDDWMTTLLQTKAFHRIPASNLQAIFTRMQRVNYRTGEVVIKQGEEGDYFYAITTGRCAVTRETPFNREGIKLADLGPGDTFGEEALISESKRNATVTMLTDGALMRLNKSDFNSLLNEPMLQWVTYEDAASLVESSGARWLDVRLPSEFESSHLPGAINIPLYFLRLKIKQLDQKTQYVVICDTGRRSSAGAFILNERGYEAVVLRGGMTAADLVRNS
jgi:CRP-like cAMP-binding protein